MFNKLVILLPLRLNYPSYRKRFFFQLSKSMNVNKDRVELYTGVPFFDSKFTHSKRCVPTCQRKRSLRLNSLKKLLTHNTRVQKERCIKNLSNDKVKLLSRHLKFIPTPPVPSSNKPSLKDFNNFARTMLL